jgi:cell division protein ZipA
MDVFGPREILIIIGVLVVVAILLDGARRVKNNRYENLQMSSRKLRKASADTEGGAAKPPAAGEIPLGQSRVVGIRDDEQLRHAEDSLHGSTSFGFEPEPSQAIFDLDNAIFDRPPGDQKRETEPTPALSPQKEQLSSDNESAQDVLVMHLMANKGETVTGADLLNTILGVGLRYGAMKIFHRHLLDDGSGPVLFSMANLLNPGTFDLNTIRQLQIPGVTLFMALDDIEEPVEAFDIMIKAIDVMATALDLNVMDESRSSMTAQTIDHYRQRARDVSFQRGQDS